MTVDVVGGHVEAGIHSFHAREAGYSALVFFFFSNRLGCLPSLLLSIVITVALLVLTGVL